MANVEQEPKQQGRNVTMTLAPLPVGKRKRNFQSDRYLPPLEDEADEGDEGDEADDSQEDASGTPSAEKSDSVDA